MRTTTIAGRTWHFTRAIGEDSVVRGMRYPCSAAIAADGAIFVLSRGMPQWMGGGPGGHTSGCKIGKWTIEGDRIGDFAQREFSWPTSVAVAADGTVYCADEHENCVAAFGPDGPFYPFADFNPDGEHLSRWGETGQLPGQLNGPAGLAFDAADNLYVVDSLNDRVQQFTKEGRFLMTWGGPGEAEGQFRRPWGITVDNEGSVYVADWGNNRVQKFAPDGAFLMRFGSADEDGGELDHPVGVAVDSDGDVYVTDWGNKRVQVYEPDGEVIGALYGDASDPFDGWPRERELDPETVKAVSRVEDMTAMGRFDRPMGIAVDGRDRIYVIDCGLGDSRYTLKTTATSRRPQSCSQFL